MASNIKFKRSAVQNRVPTTAQLELGELALNTYDGKLYCEKNDGSASVVEIGQQLSVLVVDGDNGGGNGDVTFHGATANRDLLWDASANTLIARDNAIIAFGDTGTPDLKIFHDASNSYIQNITGNLILKNNSANYIIGVNATGAVELNHNGNKRFETTADGADVSGTGSLKLPVGTTGQRNSSPTAGDMRYNSTTGSFEGYTTGWGELGGSGIGIGSTSVNPGSGVVNPLIGVGFTTINFVGAGLSVTGYGSTVVVDLGEAISRKYGRKIHSYTATNNQTTFTGISYSNGATQVSVYLNGAKLSAAAYTATSGNTVVLGTGASTGDEVEIIIIAGGVDISRTVHSYTATAGQTVFTGLGYEDGGDLDVYLNGIRLAQGDYTANNGTTLTLAVGASVGDLLEIVDMGPGAEWKSGFGADTDDIYRMQGGVGIGTTNPTDKLNIVGNAEVLGVLTATTFKGDGSLLTGIVSDKIFEGNTSVETVDTGSNGSVTVTTEGTARVTVTNATTTVSNNLTVSGNLQVDGTNTIVNSTTMTVDDKNIVLASGAANDAAADGGGITLESGNGNKTWNWIDATDAWTSSEHINIASNSKRLKLGAAQELQLHHDGTDSFIQNTSAGGVLTINNDGTDMVLSTDADLYLKVKDTEVAVKCVADGATELYHNNVKTFQTGTHGVHVFAPEGGSAQLYLYADEGDDNADQWGLISSHTSSKFSIDNYASGGWETSLTCEGNGAVKLFYDNAKTFETINGGATVTGQLYVTAEINLINGSSNAAKYIDCGLGDNNALTIRGTSGGDANHETLAKFIRNGACELYHDTSKKIETTSAGVSITGNCNVSTEINTGRITISDDGSLSPLLALKADDQSPWAFVIKNDTYSTNNSHGLQGYQNNSGDMVIRNRGNSEYLNLYLQQTDGSNNRDHIKLTAAGATELYYQNNKRFQTEGTGCTIIQGSGAYGLNISGSENGKIKLSGANDPYIRFLEGSTDKAYIQWSTSGFLQIVNQEDGSRIRLQDDIQFTQDGSTYHKIWHAGNDGSGSGLDADLLDGMHQGSFFRSDADDTHLYFHAAANLNSTGDGGIGILSGKRLGFDQSGTRSWTIKAASGNLIVASGDGSGSFQAPGFTGNGSGLTNVNATTLDSIDSVSFLRSDASDVAEQRIQFTANATHNWDDIANSGGSQGCLEIYNSQSGNDAFMAFHTGGDYALYFGLDADSNDLAVGGWSMGANKYKIWHQNNDGSGSGLDADTVDGIQGASFLRSDANDTASGDITFSGGAGAVQLAANSDMRMASGNWTGDMGNDNAKIQYHSNNMYINCGGNVSNLLILRSAGTNKVLVKGDGRIHWDNSGPAMSGDANYVYFKNTNNENGLGYYGSDGYSPNLYFYENGNETWSGNPGNDTGKIEYHSNAFYIVGGGNASALCRFRLDGTDKAHINTTGDFIARNGNTCWHNGLGDITSGLDQDIILRGLITTSTSSQTATNCPGLASTSNHYAYCYQEAWSRPSGNWSNPYPDAIFGYHTGVRIGGHQNYGGTRFYPDHPSANTTKLFSIGEGDTNTRCYYHFLPSANNNSDLGSTSLRWRNVYTYDMNLSNEGSQNDVDGTWGSYTIQEGENDLFLINRRNGKKFKFNLTEVS